MPGRISATPGPLGPVEPGAPGAPDPRALVTRDGRGLRRPSTGESVETDDSLERVADVATDDGAFVDGGCADGSGQAVAGPLVPRGGHIDRYTVLSELGSGGMGVVYKAWDPALNRPVALKVMVAGRFAARRQINRFLNEARAIARLDDPTLVAVYDTGLVEGCPFFTMEYIDGTPLDAVLALDGPLAPRRAARVAAAVARGLHHAHGQGVVHRDVKPANVLIDEHDHARLIDFGIARLLEADDGHTRTGVVVGTPAFMAPEQAEGRAAAIGPATDVYGVGGLLLHAVTGGPPRPVSPDAPLVGEALPRDLRAICARALAREPTARYPSAEALADDLERFVRGEPVEAALPGPVRRLAWALRRGAPVLAAAGVAMLVGLLIFSAVSTWRADRRAAAEAERRAQREAAAAERLDEALAAARRVRAAGDPRRAEQIERDAAQSPVAQGTDALARFHLTRAREAESEGHAEAALAAASAAYATAEHEDRRFEAMLTLGHLFAWRLDATALAALVSTLDRRFPDRRADGVALRFYERVLAGDFRAAAPLAAAAEPDWGPILRAIGRGTRTEHRLPDLSITRRWYRPWVADVTGDGRPELWTGQQLLSTGDPSLPTLPWPDPPLPGDMVRPIDGLPGAFVNLSPAPGRLARRDGDGWRTLHHDARWFADAATAADLDGDGQPELYAMTGDGLRTFLPGADPGDPWRAVEADPAADAVGAFMVTLRRVDLGEPLLLAATQGWKAYDVRLYRALGEGRLALAARRQIGRVRDAVALADPHGRRLIAAAVRAEGIDRRLFHPDDGPLADGIHVFEWTADGLEHRTRLPTAPGHDHIMRLWSGDIDGDGLADLLALVGSEDPRRAIIHRRLPAGWAPPLPLLGFYPFGLIDVDGDGDVEVIGNDTASDRLWVLGAGADRPPVRPAPTLPPVDAGGRAAAIEDLVAIGRFEEALDAWYREMLVGSQPDRAARIAERLGRYDEAAELHLLAAEKTARARGALAEAAAASRAARRPQRERDILARLAAADLEPEQRARVAARIEALDARLESRITYDFDAPLDPAWHIPVPDRLELDRAAGALHVHGDVVGESMRLPLERVGDRIGLEVELEVDRLEFAGGLELALVARRPDGAEETIAALVTCAWGGGAIMHRRGFVELPAGDQMVVFNEQIDDTTGRPLRVHVEYDHGSGRVTLIDRETERARSRRVHLDPIGDELALVMRHTVGPRGSSTTLHARILRLILDGVRRRPWTPGPLDAATRALAERRFDDVLSLLDGRDDPPADAIRIAALYARGDWRTADRLMRRHLTAGLPVDSPVERILRRRLRRDPLHFAPMVRAAWGPRADGYFWQLFEAGFLRHHGDAEMIRAAGAVLAGADDDPQHIVDHPQPDALLELWFTRARMRRAAGDGGGARADFERIEAALRHLPSPEGRRQAFQRSSLWTRLRLERASLEAPDDPDAAAEWVRAALSRSSAPVITADRIRADEGLRGLADHPVWREVEAAARR